MFQRIAVYRILTGLLILSAQVPLRAQITVQDMWNTLKDKYTVGATPAPDALATVILKGVRANENVDIVILDKTPDVNGDSPMATYKAALTGVQVVNLAGSDLKTIFGGLGRSAAVYGALLNCDKSSAMVPPQMKADCQSGTGTNLLINGEWLDTAREYRVAMNDSRIPASKDKADPRPNLAAHVCQLLSKDGTLCENAPPPGPVAALDSRMSMNCGDNPDWKPSRPLTANSPMAKSDLRQQGCRLAHFGVANMQFAINAVHPNLTDAAINAGYTGVADTRAAQTHSQDISLSGSVFWLSEGPHFTYGLESSFNVAQKDAGDSSTGEKISISQNQIAVYPVFALTNRHRAWNWSYFRFTPQYFTAALQPIYTYAYTSGQSAAPGSAPLVNFGAAKPWGSSLRAGTRLDGTHTSKGQDNYLEFGWQYNKNYEVVKELDFASTAAAGNFKCLLQPSIALAKCAPKGAVIGQGTSISALYATTLHPGLYWTFKGTLPIKSSKKSQSGKTNATAKADSTAKDPQPWLSLVVDGSGDFNFNSATQFATETRFDSIINIGFNIPLAGKLQSVSIKPTYSWFAYQNLNEGNRIYVSTYGLKLGFNLDRHSRISVGEALKYGPAPTSGGQ